MSRCADVHYAKQREHIYIYTSYTIPTEWGENETKEGRKGRECIVECSRRRCSASSGCNEQNGEFLGEDILGYYSSS